MEQNKQIIKFWTVQRKDTVRTVLENGVFYPEIDKSNFTKEQQDLSELYKFVLDCFNANNKTEYNGLVFTFMKMINDDIYEFRDYKDFLTGIYINKEKILSLWNTFNKEDYVILELEIENPYNPELIEINNFQYLMPPFVEFLPPYQPGDARTIINWLINGTIGKGYFPNSLVQAHLPYIKKEDIKGIYEFATIEELEKAFN